MKRRCEWCTYEYTRTDNYKRHMERRHHFQSRSRSPARSTTRRSRSPTRRSGSTTRHSKSRARDETV
ncbi:MAG: hypothetical protein ABW185_01205, partial [Sedimenticola sp.]